MNALALPLHVARFFCCRGLRFPVGFVAPPFVVSLCFGLRRAWLPFLPVSLHGVSASIALGGNEGFVVLVRFAVCALLYLGSMWIVECPSLLHGCRSLPSLLVQFASSAHLVKLTVGSPRFWVLVPGVLTIVWLAARHGRRGRHGRSSRTFVCQSYEPCLERSPPLRVSASFPDALHWV